MEVIFLVFKDFLHEVTKACDFYFSLKLCGVMIIYLDQLSSAMLSFTFGINNCVVDYGHAHWKVRMLNSLRLTFSGPAQTTCADLREK